MNDNILTDICEIIHGLGERMPRKDTCEIIHSVLIKQMVLLIYQIQKAAIVLHHHRISIKHILYVLKNHKVTIIRILSYYLLKDTIQKLNKLGDTDENKEKTKKYELELIGIESIDTDIVEDIANLEDDSIQIDPTTTLAAIDFTIKDFSPDYSKVKSVFKRIRNSIVDMKLKINITEEEVRKTNESRLIRVNDISILVPADGYEGFEACRRKKFHTNKVGERLLLQVHKALPWDINYNNQVKDILLFLAKETIHCLIDRVFTNRKHSDIYNDNNSTNKKKMYGSIHVDEIRAVITSAWKTPLEEIHYPYDEDDEFFNNQLIFDL